jgi:Cep192 domain 4/HYDIN/CFA65/VesB-like, Ig-like domain/Protein of unknown function (DUF1565)
MLKTIARLALGVLLTATLAHAQAQVNESLETASIYVDAVNGNDSNPGTQGAPFQTISKAFSVATTNNYKDIGTLIVVNPGTYRETLNLIATQSTTSLPITVEAATNGTVIISGADVWTGWQAYSGKAGVYSQAWPYQWGECPGDTNPAAPYQEDILLRREMIFVNGQLLTQAMSMNQLVYPGMFYVDEANGVVYVYPPNGMDMDTATVEVPTRSIDLNLGGWSNVVFRGLTFQDSNACRSGRAVDVYYGASNVLFDTDVFQWNNAKGLTLDNPVSNVTVENSTAAYNGQTGFGDFQASGILWQNDVTEFNNWRGAMASFYAWGSAGAYFFQEHNGTLTNFTAAYNQTNGIHWDTDNADITAANVIAEGNLESGLFDEKNEGPVTISGSTIAGNNSAPGASTAGGGLMVRNSTNLAVTGTSLFENGAAQVSVVGQSGGITVTNWETGRVYNLVTGSITLLQNIFEGTSPVQYLLSDGLLTGTDWTTFQSTLISNSNTWWSGENALPFDVPTPSMNTYVDFGGWQNATGQDLSGSSFAQPSPDPSQSPLLPSGSPDFWMAVDNPTLNLAADGTAVFNVTVMPMGGFTGTVNLIVDGISEVPGLSGGLNTSSINTSGTAAVSLTSQPSIAAGYYPITVIANSGSMTHIAEFTLIVPTTSVRVTPATENFPSVQVNTSSAPLSVTLSNYGTAPLSIANFSLPTQFTESDNCNGSVAAGGSCTVNVTFTPNAAKTFSGQMLITDSDPTSPQAVGLNGTGLPAPVVTLSPGTLGFGLQAEGSSTTLTSVLSNVGQGELKISSMAMSGPMAAEFTESNTCGGSVAPGTSCNINVTFTPAGTGLRTATLTLTDNAATVTQTVYLSGNGSAPLALLSPLSVTFPGQVIHTSSMAKNITLKNNGGAPLDITSIAVTGANAGDFTQSNTCGTSVAAYAQCTISVSFIPQAAGTRSATLTVTDNSGSGTQTTALSGTGLSSAVTLTPTSVAFGSQTVGKKSAATKVTLKNASSSTLTISSVSLTGTNAADFTDSNYCGATLAPNASCAVYVHFDPTATGARAAALTFQTSSPDSPESVSLSGTGIQAAATLSSTSLDFGDVQVKTTSAPMAITLTNSGTASMTISGFSFTGTNKGWFAQTNTCGASLAAGGSCTISVTATPLSRTTGTASLSIKDSAPDSPQGVSLTATGD